VGVLASVLGGCGQAIEEPEQLLRDAEPTERPDDDADGDGLCTATEEHLGTSDEDWDTDRDGLPDLIEVIYGLPPDDAARPTRDQVGYLGLTTGSSLEMRVRATVEGEGQDITGSFQNLPSPYEDGSVAGDFFVSASAVGALPADSVARIDAASERFRLVTGTARLEVDVQFRNPGVDSSSGCARAYPFSYVLKDHTGDIVDERLYLLVLATTGRPPPETFCAPSKCS
jgi:hypothetical protein